MTLFRCPGAALYDFGPQHPLRPERYALTYDLLDTICAEYIECEPMSEADALRVHSPEYVEFILDTDEYVDLAEARRYGFSVGDTPPVPEIGRHALAHGGATVAAANRVRDGERLAHTIEGGLHHAQRSLASGFCVIDDPAVAVSILCDAYEKVAYVDIDLHHGDGVQTIFFDDPRVLTYSIHQDGRTLYPGTGFVDELGEQNTSVNMPLPPGTDGPTWLDAFRRTAVMALDKFQPQAIVLQTGCDSHFTDPLGALNVDVQSYLAAIALMRDLDLPMVVCGGGGYDLNNVPRMWAGCALTLARREVPQELLDRWSPVIEPRTGERAERSVQEVEQRLRLPMP